jgi:cyclophilin family peptidyl-prolyl cis-trans isomerase
MVLELHPEEVLLVFRPYPLVTNHDKSSLAVQAAESAGAQGFFWEMHDLLFSRQADWLAMTPEAFSEWVVQASVEVGVDAVALREDLENGRYEERVDSAFSEAMASGIPGVPFLFVNGEDFRIPPSLSVLSASVRLESLRPRQYTSPPPMTIDPGAQYMGRLDTSRGAIDVQLYAESAPIAVNSFVNLAREGWFDRTYFHHVVPGILVEGGDPSGTGLGDPGYSFAMELDPLLDFGEPGMVALSAESPGINSGRFFITLSPQPSLDGSRTIIGRVVGGLAILEQLPARDPLRDLLSEPALTIDSASIEGP